MNADSKKKLVFSAAIRVYPRSRQGIAMHSITLNIEETTMRGFKTFGEWHQARRRALDFTQKELAQQVNCAEISIRKIESNELRPSRALLEMLMNALRVPPEERAEMIAWARRR